MAAGEKRLRCQDLLARLAKFGVVQVRQRGSHILVQKPEQPGSRKGPTYPIPCHRQTDEVSPNIVRAALRVLGIDEKEFWAS